MSGICEELDRVVDSFPNVRWTGACCYVRLDTLSQKIREEDRIVDVNVVGATAVTAGGEGEVAGLDVGTSKDGPF